MKSIREIMGDPYLVTVYPECKTSCILGLKEAYAYASANKESVIEMADSPEECIYWSVHNDTLEYSMTRIIECLSWQGQSCSMRGGKKNKKWKRLERVRNAFNPKYINLPF